MSAFWDILELLSSPPGALLYYLIVLFSIWAIVGLALSRWSRGERGGLVARLLLAGALMSFSRFVPFIMALLSRQDGFSMVRFAPPLERFVDTLAILLVGWALVFPHRYRMVGRLTIGISVLLTVVLYILSTASWMSILDAHPQATYNGSTFQSQVWEAWQLLFLIPALVYTLVNPARERDALNAGLAVLTAGHLLQLVFPLANRVDHLSAWTRFANLIAFPLFAAAVYQFIIQRFDAQRADLEWVNQESLTHMADLMSVLDTHRKVSATLDMDTVLKDSVQAVSQFLQSDLCALALVVPPRPDALPVQGSSLPALASAGHPADLPDPSPPPAEMEMAVIYDAPQLYSEKQRMRLDEYPALQRALAQSNPLILQAGEQDLLAPQANRSAQRIHRLLGSDRAGPTLIQPLEHASTVIGALLVCRIEDPIPFTPGEARKSETLAAYLGTAIENARRHQATQAHAQQLAAELDAVKTRHTRLTTDLENRLARGEEQATLYMQRLYEAELGEQQAQEDARQARRQLAMLRQESQTEITHARDELEHSIRQATYLTQQIANLDAQCLELNSLVQMLEQEKELLQLRLAVAAPTQGHLNADTEPALDARALLVDSGNETPSTRSTNGLLAALTRDLDAPMASILEQTELFVSSTANKLDNRQSQFLRRVQAATERMQSMLNNLSSLSEIEKGSLKLQRASVDMSKVIEVALDRSKFRLEEKELQARLEIGVLPRLKADPEHMQQVIGNLVSYACRLSRPGTTIGIRAYAQDGDTGHCQLHITISEDAPVHTTEAPKAMPSPRPQANSAMEANSGESRADIEIAKALVEAHQGQLRCEEQPGRGTIFYLALPVDPAQTLAHQGAEGV